MNPLDLVLVEFKSMAGGRMLVTASRIAAIGEDFEGKVCLYHGQIDYGETGVIPLAGTYEENRERWREATALLSRWALNPKILVSRTMVCEKCKKPFDPGEFAYFGDGAPVLCGRCV